MKKWFIIKCKGFPEVENLIRSSITVGINEIKIRRVRSKYYIFGVKLNYLKPYEFYGKEVVKEYKQKEIGGMK